MTKLLSALFLIALTSPGFANLEPSAEDAVQAQVNDQVTESQAAPQPVEEEKPKLQPSWDYERFAPQNGGTISGEQAQQPVTTSP